MNKIGVLLVNLGTPDSSNARDVKKYLIEFLMDERVIDTSWLSRLFVVRGLIVPKRYRESARFYKKIWTPKGSPLLVYGREVQKLLQHALGEEFQVELAMRYGNPSIESSLNRLKECEQIIIVPLFPQYASATTGSVHQKIMEVISSWLTIPDLSFVHSYATHPMMIDAFVEIASEYTIEDYDHFLFSFHGLPEKQIRKADQSQHCLKTNDCCQKKCQQNRQCYSAQCYATATAIARKLNLAPDFYSLSFQSRLGKEPWLKPYTTDVLADFVKRGYKKILVMCPAFICDCVETLHEISVEYQEDFANAGGEKLQLIRGLNQHPTWIKALVDIVQNRVYVP